MKTYFILGIIMIASYATSAIAETRIELNETKVQGASELPKVLYIVPWKKTEMDTKPVKLNTMVEEVMTPVDRDVLKRQVQFYEENQLGQ
ncbi:MAG: hypothetical protein PVF34_05600 [Gammaproteobacteria bacterium]|jgi:hypothetical protein|nr:hypothetical protein [Gammaproteobacteria bacterium]